MTLEIIDQSGVTPDIELDVRQTFDLDVDLKVPAFSTANDYVPSIDEAYKFDEQTTLAILAGFTYNRRVMIQGYHGSGKSTHIEQVAARLNWPCVRVNLDSHISRIDLLGKDAIVLKDGKQITEFKEGILPWAVQTPTALVFDEYDAGRPDVMFVIQRVLEVEGKLTLLDQNKVITPHPSFRLFSTANTVGLGDTTGLYHGTQQINQGQMDRWHIVSTLNYLDPELELSVVLAKVPSFDTEEGREEVINMISTGNLTRQGFASGDISTLMSPRTIITWAENTSIFNDRNKAFEGKDIDNNNLSNLKFHYPSIRKEFDESKSKGFVSAYKEKFGVSPSKYAARGFDVTLDILLRLATDDNLYEASNEVFETEYIENKFRYTKSLYGGYANEAVYIVKYDNLRIIEAN